MIAILSLLSIVIVFLLSPSNSNGKNMDKEAQIISLDAMTISLVKESHINTYKSIPQLKINIALKLNNPENVKWVQSNKPKIRNKIIEYLSKKDPDDFNNYNAEIKKKKMAKLKEELKILTLTNFLPNEKNLKILFSEYFIQ